MDHPTTPPDTESWYQENQHPETYTMQTDWDTTDAERRPISIMFAAQGFAAPQKHIDLAPVRFDGVTRWLRPSTIPILAHHFYRTTGIPCSITGPY